MLRHVIALTIFLCSQILFGQSIGIGTITPDNSAVIDMTSSDQGVLVPRMSSAARQAIVNPATGLMVFDSTNKAFYFFTGNGWLELLAGYTDHITDADGDTKIQAEETTDEDILRFDLAGTEYFNMINGRLNVVNTGNSVFLGDLAGEYDDLTNNQNAFVGYKSGHLCTTCSNNVSLGYQAFSQNPNNVFTGMRNTAIGSHSLLKGLGQNDNTAIGYNALGSMGSGTANVAIGSLAWLGNLQGSYGVVIGANAGEHVQNGVGNVLLGYQSGAGSNSHTKGRNVMIGYQSGQLNHKNDNVFIGYQSGQNELNGNRLYIENTNADSANALIYGEFNNDWIRINGRLSPMEGITDADGDTKIQVEENADDNIIRFDIEGIEVMRIDSTGKVVIGEADPVGALNMAGDVVLFNSALRNSQVPSANYLLFAGNNDTHLAGNSWVRLLAGEDQQVIVSRDSITFEDHVVMHHNLKLTNLSSDNSPSQMLVKDSSGTVYMRDVATLGNDISNISDADDDTKIQLEESVDDDIIRFDIKGTEAMRIDSTGKVVIGEASPLGALNVKNDLYLFNGSVRNSVEPNSNYISFLGNNDTHLAGDSWVRLIADEEQQVIVSADSITFEDHVVMHHNLKLTNLSANNSQSQMLVKDSSGSVYMRDAATLGDDISKISDTDGDTKIQVEESPDENTIRFDVKGNQAMVIDSNGKVLIGENQVIVSADSITFEDQVVMRHNLKLTNLSANNAQSQMLVKDPSGAVYMRDAATLGDDISNISDADDDTKIQLEESADEDVIRFDLAGAEYFTMHPGRVEFLNTGNSVFLGFEAGFSDDFSDNRNAGVGHQVLKDNTTGRWNSALGYAALRGNTTGQNNVAIGFGALSPVNSTGNDNVAIGKYALLQNNSGNNNVAIGSNAAQNLSSGSGNVFIGYSVAQSQNVSNRLMIDNSDTTETLIYGEFDNNLLTVNGTLRVNDGTQQAGRVLTSDMNGNASWKIGVPVGCIQMWPVSTPPAGWLVCNGSTFDAGTYPELSTLLGGNTLPDFEGRFPVGAGDSGTFGSTNHNLGDLGGEEMHLLTISEMPSHRHAIQFREGEEGGTGNIYSDINGGNDHTGYTDFEGGSNAHNNMPPFYTIQFIIKAE